MFLYVGTYIFIYWSWYRHITHLNSFFHSVSPSFLPCLLICFPFEDDLSPYFLLYIFYSLFILTLGSHLWETMEYLSFLIILCNIMISWCILEKFIFLYIFFKFVFIFSLWQSSNLLCLYTKFSFPIQLNENVAFFQNLPIVWKNYVKGRKNIVIMCHCNIISNTFVKFPRKRIAVSKGISSFSF